MGSVLLIVGVVLSLAGCKTVEAADGATIGSGLSSSSATTTANEPSPSAEELAPPEPAPVVDVDQALAAAQAQTALATAGLLEVKGRAPKTGYSRDAFGQAWADTDHNGCDTRNDILARDLTGLTFKPGTQDCVVLTGTLADPYSGKSITFTRGQGTSEAVQIDHVVALSDAWQKGATQWDATKREQLANDPMNLLAVDGPLNGQKSDGDAATWLPPNKAFRCTYVARQVGVKYTYGLWVTEAEKAAIVGVLSTCPDEPLPLGAATPPPPAPEPAPVAPAPAPAPAAPAPAAPAPAPAAPAPAPAAPAPAPAPAAGNDPQFGTCKAAKAAGYGPYVSGVDPEYDWYRDADSDGIVCE